MIGSYKTHNMDGRAFIREVVKPDIISHLSDTKPLMVIMNLPAMAEKFLDDFIDLISIDDGSQTVASENHPPVMIHCYCFSKGMCNVSLHMDPFCNGSAQTRMWAPLNHYFLKSEHLN